MKTFVLAVLTLIGVSQLNAQDASSHRYGIKAGFNSFSVRASAGDISASDNASGFYVGSFAEFAISESFDLQPELQFVSISENGDNSAFLLLPVMAKYNANEKFSILAGPQFDYLLDEDSEGINKFGIGLAAGLSYDISTNFVLDARYVLGLTNRLENNSAFGEEDLNVKFDFIQVGLGYKF